MVSSQPVHRVLDVPLHHLPAFRSCISVQTGNMTLTQHSCSSQRVSVTDISNYLESIIFLAASAYLNKSFLASSLYLIRESLKFVGKLLKHYHILKYTSEERCSVPDGDVVHDLSEHGWGNDRVAFAGQERIQTFIHHLSLQKPAVEGFPRGLYAWKQTVNCLHQLFQNNNL